MPCDLVNPDEMRLGGGGVQMDVEYAELIFSWKVKIETNQVFDGASGHISR